MMTPHNWVFLCKHLIPWYVSGIDWGNRIDIHRKHEARIQIYQLWLNRVKCYELACSSLCNHHAINVEYHQLEDVSDNITLTPEGRWVLVRWVYVDLWYVFCEQPQNCWLSPENNRLFPRTQILVCFSLLNQEYIVASYLSYGAYLITGTAKVWPRK